MVKQIQLTQGYEATVDDEDYETLSKYLWYAYRKDKYVYAARKCLGRRLQMHVAIINPRPGLVVDHKDNNGLNNQRNNLREATRAQNKQNNHSPIIGKSKYRGVAWDKDRNKWIAYITIHYTRIKLGRFSSEVEAARAYNIAALRYHREFSVLNQTDPVEEFAAVKHRKPEEVYSDYDSQGKLT